MSGARVASPSERMLPDLSTASAPPPEGFLSCSSSEMGDGDLAGLVLRRDRDGQRPRTTSCSDGRSRRSARRRLGPAKKKKGERNEKERERVGQEG